MVNCFFCGQEFGEDDKLCPDCSEIDNIEQLCECAAALQSQRSLLDRQIDAVKGRCKAILSEPGSRIYGAFQVDWRQYERQQLNFRKLRSDHPQLMDAYSDHKQIDSLYINKLAI